MKKSLIKKSRKFHFSPLRYPGGKTFLFSFFDDIIKNNKLNGVTYIEPFAGGAGAALALLLLEKVDKIVINDLDKAIYSFWMSAVFNSEKFIKKIKSTPVTIDEWKKQKKIYSKCDDDQFKLGFAAFFLNRTNVSGILNGGPIGGINQLGKWKIDARFNKEKLIEMISRISMYKDRIIIKNEDGIKLIHSYLHKENVFIYLDPPYYDKGAALYLNHYKNDNHVNLARELNNNPNSFWLLTYDDKKEIKNLYKDRRIVKFSFNYNAYESRLGKEVMILSDVII